VAQPADIDGHCITVSASLGITLFPNDAADADTLLRHADQAMYIAKQSGKNRYHLFDQDRDQVSLVRGETLAGLETALRNQEFVLYFQPKINMRTGRILGAEALIRWHHPERRILLPADFLPVLEGTDLSATVGDWVIAAALKHRQAWLEQGLEIAISINVAPNRLLRPDFAETLKRYLGAYPMLHPADLELEILETTSWQDISRLSAVMNECRELGVAFALDDFGSGYASLTHLKALPADTLKIDHSFVRNMLRDAGDRAIVEGIIKLAATFHREVIAEGLESVEHGSLLLKMGCEKAQGYGIAPPMPAEDLPDWVRNWRPNPVWMA